MAAAYGAGIGLTLHTPTTPFFDNEVGKRDFMFQLAKPTGADWFLIIDADEVVTSATPDLKQLLEATHTDVAYYLLIEPNQTRNYVRGLYRNHPELGVKKRHYGYCIGDRFLWDGTGELAENLTDHLVLEHRSLDRDPDRRQRAIEYYRVRDEAGVERPDDEPRSHTFILEGKA